MSDVRGGQRPQLCACPPVVSPMRLLTSIRAGGLVCAALALGAALSAGPALAASVSESGSKLVYTAADGEQNLVFVKVDGNEYVIREEASGLPAPAMTAGAGCTLSDPSTMRCTKSGITEIDVSLGDGSDLFDGNTLAYTNNSERALVPMHVDGGAGDDALYGGFGDDVLTGGPGDDHLGKPSAGSNITPTADGDVFEGRGRRGHAYRKQRQRAAQRRRGQRPAVRRRNPRRWARG